MAEQATQKQEEKAQQPVGTMAEAGFSMNVKMIDPAGQEVMLTFRCALASNADKLIDHYSHITQLLIKAGWQAGKGNARPAAATATAANEPGPGEAPNCPVHGAPMKPSKRPGSFFCSKKLADGSYCKSQV